MSMTYSIDDTVVELATAQGLSAIAVIRLSGKDCILPVVGLVTTSLNISNKTQLHFIFIKPKFDE